MICGLGSERGTAGPSIIVILLILTAMEFFYGIYLAPSYTPYTYIGIIVKFDETSLVVNTKKGGDIHVGDITNIADFRKRLSDARDQKALVTLTLRERRSKIPSEISFKIFEVEIID